MTEAKALQHRTKKFAVRALRVYRSMQGTSEGDIVGRQFFRAATSVAANYRAACRAKSRKDFIFKLGVVEEEADECQFWLEFIAESEMLPQSKLKDLASEASELTAIFVSSRQTAKANNRKSEIANREFK